MNSLVWFATGVVATLLATVVVLQAWRVDAAPGDLESTFVPIPPCRLIDTRQAGQMNFTEAETRTLDAHGTNGTCTIPSTAVGLSMNVTAVAASTPGDFVTIWPAGLPRPNASSLNPSPGQPPIPNAVTTPLSAEGQFNVFNFVGTLDLIIDVNGYYTNTFLSDLAARITDNEAGIAANTARITDNEAGIAANTARITDNEAGIAALDAREPFAVTARDDGETVTGAEVVVSVSVTAPVAGHVTVNSTTNVFEETADNAVQCTITTGAGIDFQYLQGWESPGPAGALAQLAGTRVFDIAANGTGTFNLVCQNATLSESTIGPSVLTAIFTPSP